MWAKKGTSAVPIAIWGLVGCLPGERFFFEGLVDSTRNPLVDEGAKGGILLGLFWPERPDARARRALTQALWQIRSALGPAADRLEADRDKYTVYVKPELVVEIAYNDLQESSRYPGGLALRFARVKGFREDKSAAEADTIQTVWSIFEESTG